MTALAWHYTIGTRYAAIARSGAILPARDLVPKGERPIVWFSTRETFEPTAIKPMMFEGRMHRLTLEQLRQVGDGLVRLGYPLEGLLAWPEVGVQAGMPRKLRRALEATGRQQGANPAHWLGTFEPVPVRYCVVECSVDGRQWLAGGPAA